MKGVLFINMSNEEIFGIIDYLNSLSFSEFELETSDLKIRIKRSDSEIGQVVPKKEQITQESTPPTEQQNLPSVLAPISGVYYQASAPGEKSFAKVGKKVREGDTLCILEAMKMMIEVKADKDGEIVEILGQDGFSVDEGQVLFIFKGE